MHVDLTESGKPAKYELLAFYNFKNYQNPSDSDGKRSDSSQKWKKYYPPTHTPTHEIRCVIMCVSQKQTIHSWQRYL